MKHLVLAIALTLAAVQPALAQSRGGQGPRQEDRRDDRRDEDRRDDRRDDRDDRSDRIVGAVIGGIIGLIDADRFDRDHGPGRGGPGGPGRGGPGHGGPGGGWNDVRCFAENRRGQIFTGRDQSARRAQDRAMNACYAVSRNCRPAGCQR